MSKVIVSSFMISIDGYSSAPGQSLEHPFGPGGHDVGQWFFPTDVFQQMANKKAGETGIDNEWALKGTEGMGAWILGRNMYSHSRGPWTDDGWKGWWGPNPPYHVPTFILTHHKHDPIEMEGGTTFIFVTDGIAAALDQAKKVAGSKKVRIGGGATTVRQYLAAGLIDELHLAQSPVLLGAGESIFHGVDLRKIGYECTGSVKGERTTHLTIQKKG